jgi:hypothetical protein
MSATIIQGRRALKVLPSDNCDVPFPATIKSGTTTSSPGPNVLSDSSGLFITNNVRVGDIVYNTTDGTAATIVEVQTETILVLNANITAAIGKSYTIYQASSQTTIGNQGCVLYIGGAGNVTLTTNGGDAITLVGLNTGQFVPVQALKVAATGTTATNIIALW